MKTKTNNIAKWRKEIGLNVMELADKCELNTNTISYLESGRLSLMNCRLSTLVKLSKALNQPLQRLLKGKELKECVALFKGGDYEENC